MAINWPERAGDGVASVPWGAEMAYGGWRCALVAGRKHRNGRKMPPARRGVRVCTHTSMADEKFWPGMIFCRRSGVPAILPAGKETIFKVKIVPLR